MEYRERKSEMGVPSFYRWLVGKYPNIVVNAIEEEGDSVDSSHPNPNGMEFHNLYLDMNGIIHPCFHPEDQLFPPTTYDEVFIAIFNYIDRIFRIVRPRRLLYMAIDGVAPRAKMNQQRSRRFKTAKDAEIAEAEEDKLRKEFEREGKEVLPKQECEVSDSNVITPGTLFMERLSKALEYYIHSRLNDDPGWKSINVILSDASVPGEGEHKIMSYIRLQRNLPGYDPNTHHCLYGLDADLIMLALATHEIHFSILREDVLKQGEQAISLSSIEATLSRQEFNTVKSRGWFGRVLEAKGRGASTMNPYQFVNIWILREYIAVDLMVANAPFDIDIERIIDDFIFICFFTGNDFIPHLPTLEIHEGAIDLLISVYKKVFNKMAGYVIDTSAIKDKKIAFINVKRVESFLLEVGSYEDRIFEKRYKLRQKKIQRLLQQRHDEERDTDFENLENSRYGFHKFRSGDNLTCDQRKSPEEMHGLDSISCDFAKKCSTFVEQSGESDAYRNTKELKQKLKDLLRENGDLFKNGAFENDKVKLGSQGWRERYYREKFLADSPTEIEKTRKEIVQKYMEGVCWVLQYYFAGVCSWGWYYPFNYGPFASDMKALSCSNIVFKIGSPFKPFDQLMAVLPSRSSHALPNAYRELMNSEDSEIKNFYPYDFPVDMDGKRFAWQGVVRLPLIDEGLLLKETRLLEKHLNIDEVRRNSFNYDKIIVRDSNSLGDKICSIYTLSEQKPHPIDCLSCHINGYVSISDDYTGHCIFSSPVEGLKDIIDDHVISAIFKNPDHHDHIPNLLANVTVPDKTITDGDIVERKLWHEYEGPQHNQSSSHHRYSQGANVSWQTASRTSTHESWKSAGNGWSSGGRGKEISHGNYSRENYERSFGRGHGSFQVQHFGQVDDASRWEHVGRGSGRYQHSNQHWRSVTPTYQPPSTGFHNPSNGRFQPRGPMPYVGNQMGNLGFQRPVRYEGNSMRSSGFQQRCGNQIGSTVRPTGFQKPVGRTVWQCRSAPMGAESGRGRGRGRSSFPSSSTNRFVYLSAEERTE